MSWRTALANLAAVPVPGVVTSYDLATLPDVLPAAHLPALVPAFPNGGGALEAGQGLSTLTYDGGAWRAALAVDHVLYWTPVAASGGLQAVLPCLVEAVDAYLAALCVDGTLGGALHEPLVVARVSAGVQEYGGVAYYGARFRHQWVITVGE